MPSSSTTTPTTSSMTTLTPETLENDLLAHLASSTALDDLHSTLLCSLQRAGWTEKIRRLSLELLRGGRCERFDEVVEAVVASAEGRGHAALWGEENSTQHQNQSQNTESEDGIDASADVAALRNLDVRIPSEVVEQGVRAIKEVLREVVVLEDDGDEGQQQNNGTEKEKDKDKDKDKGHKHGSGGGGGGGNGGGTEKPRSSSKAGPDGLKNGGSDTSPVKKTEKKPKPGKQK